MISMFRERLPTPHPTDEKNHIGNSLVTSATLQYHFLEYFWPEFALNDTQWTSGERTNRNQLLNGPGIMFGRFQGRPIIQSNCTPIAGESHSESR
jgi:hypothetical protein